MDFFQLILLNNHFLVSMDHFIDQLQFEVQIKSSILLPLYQLLVTVLILPDFSYSSSFSFNFFTSSFILSFSTFLSLSPL